VPAEDVGDPSLVVANGAWQLYYTVRTGTRTAIALMVSDELVVWRAPVGDVPVLAADGTGFDRISVSTPEAVVRGERVELFYTGSDGTRTTLGLATRTATPLGTY
jgi:hypothetical protein